MSVATRRTASCLLALGAVLGAPAAQAISFDLDVGEGLSGTLNSTLILGGGLRMQDRSVNLVGKANLNPAVCAGPSAAYQSCQGVIRDQTHPARALARSPGQAFLNADDGNLNYDRGDPTQAVFKVTQDLSLSYGDYGFFGKWLYFYDFVNNDFTEFHPNWITAANRDTVGATGDANSNAVFNRTYGPGAPVYTQRTDGEVLRQIGTDLQMMDYYVYGTVGLPFNEAELTWKVGNQTLNWGESTALVINSLNQVNPVNVNNLYRVGFDLSELFIPTGMVVLSTEPFENTTVEAFYGYDWEPVEIPAPGSFFSFADLGTNNAMDYASISFGGPAEDPDVCGTGTFDANDPFSYSNAQSGCGSPTNNPLSGLTNTALTIRRQADNEASNSGQFGFTVKYFAEWLNNGTELAFYFMNYHSQLPYVSFYSTVASCARAEGNALGLDVTNSAELVQACPDLPFTHPGDDDAARAATSNAVPIDTVRYRVEYPENIKMFGVSFNTTVGDISLQGELAYRPDMPLQVDLQDLTFHALGPMLTRCHDATQTATTPQPDSCGTVGTGSTASVGQDQTGTDVAYGSSNFVPYPGMTAFPDTFNLAIGAGVGSARSFPSFIGAYRGVAPGETPPNSYIRGWELFDVYQLNIGGTYVQGVTDNVIGADQLIWLFEVGAQWVPDLPGTEILQIESPNTNYHASAGADGTMTGNYAQDCAHTPDCNYSGYNPETGQIFAREPAVDPNPCTPARLAANEGCGDGLRFNPHQEPADGYADAFSAGYVIVSLIRYESVFPGISFAPFTIFQHDVVGTSTDVAAQFTEGRKDISFLFETRYKESLAFTTGYTWFTGGGSYNLQKDRDQLVAFVKYQF